MTSHGLIKSLKDFSWGSIKNFRGSVHSSMIGFISTSRIDSIDSVDSRDKRFILDGAPTVKKGERRQADIILCESKETIAVVEVESTIKNYKDKINNLKNYLTNDDDSPALEFGILFMLNYPSYRHHIWNNPGQMEKWVEVEKKVRDVSSKTKKTIGLISFVKKKDALPLDEDKYRPLKERIKNNYYHWQFNEIAYKFFLPDCDDPEGGIIWPLPQ